MAAGKWIGGFLGFITAGPLGALAGFALGSLFDHGLDEVNNLKMLVNYGMDQMRFGQPVITGSRVRLVATLHDIQNLRGICKTSIKFSIEIEGQRKPALSGIASFLYYFNN